MEEWLAQGSLTEQEFATLVRLTARYVFWDVDQFDHWALPTPEGPMWVNFLWHMGAYGADAYRPMWPHADDGAPAWTVWRLSDDGNRSDVARYADERPARAMAEYLERLPGRQGLYEVTPPTSGT